MDFYEILSDTISKGETVSINNILTCEIYCAQLQVYRKYLAQNRERAELFLNDFHKYNDMVFKQAVEILDIAIKEANVELAQETLKTIEIMKNTYPEFYNSYYRQLFGK